jgi:hypothetical protein
MQALVQQLASGNVTWLTGVVFCVAALALGALGGAFGGVLVGGRHIGYGLAAMMGTFFGPIAALPGILVALVLVLLLGR